MKPDHNFWSKDLGELRREKGLSQRQLAELAKVNRTTLRAIEDGTSPIPIDVYERLLAVLGYELVPIKRGLAQRAPQTGIDRDRSRTT